MIPSHLEDRLWLCGFEQQAEVAGCRKVAIHGNVYFI